MCVCACACTCVCSHICIWRICEGVCIYVCVSRAAVLTLVGVTDPSKPGQKLRSLLRKTHIFMVLPRMMGTGDMLKDPLKPICRTS